MSNIQATYAAEISFFPQTVNNLILRSIPLRGHTLDIFSFSILETEEDMFKRILREAIEIFCPAPTENRDAGFELPAIYQKVLSRDWQYKSRLLQNVLSITRKRLCKTVFPIL